MKNIIGPKLCPKCQGEMEEQDEVALPQYIAPSAPGVMPFTPSLAKIERPFPLTGHMCRQCRYVELWA